MKLAELNSLRRSLWSTLEGSAEARDSRVFGIMCGVVLEDILKSAATKREWVGERNIWTGTWKEETLRDLATSLKNDGIISDTALDFSFQIWEMRNEAAHGKIRAISAEDSRNILSKLRSLAASYGWRHQAGVLR